MKRHCNHLCGLQRTPRFLPGCLLQLLVWLSVPICAVVVMANLTAQEIASHSSTAEISGYFPFQIGSRWTYKVVSETADGRGTQKARGRFSDTVIAIDSAFGPAVQLVEIEENGIAPDYAFCHDAPRPLKWWYVVNNQKVFSRCTQQEAEELGSSLKASPQTDIVDGLEYLLPFHVGALWGADPEDQDRTDVMYQWSIDDKTDVKVQAGKFKGCYDILFRTMPDHEERWICPGVGLTSLEYEHHGTVHHYLIELQSYSIGTPVLSHK
jgi:hypothetical protein